MASFEMKNYVEVRERVQQFYKANPDGRIQSDPPRIVEIGGRTFVEVTTRVYRSPDDPIPCVGSAWEAFPGRTPYTKDSEMMNAETSAMGRALAAAGIAVDRSIASANEVRNRQADRDAPDKPRKRTKPAPALTGPRKEIADRIGALDDEVRVEVKRQFVERFGGPPADVVDDRIDEAVEFVARFETLTAPDSALDSPLTAADAGDAPSDV